MRSLLCQRGLSTSGRALQPSAQRPHPRQVVLRAKSSSGVEQQWDKFVRDTQVRPRCVSSATLGGSCGTSQAAGRKGIMDACGSWTAAQYKQTASRLLTKSCFTVALQPKVTEWVEDVKASAQRTYVRIDSEYDLTGKAAKVRVLHACVYAAALPVLSHPQRKAAHCISLSGCISLQIADVNAVTTLMHGAPPCPQAAKRVQETAKDVDQQYGVMRRLRSWALQLQKEWPIWSRKFEDFAATTPGKVVIVSGLFLLMTTPVFWRVSLYGWLICNKLCAPCLRKPLAVHTRTAQQNNMPAHYHTASGCCCQGRSQHLLWRLSSSCMLRRYSMRSCCCGGWACRWR